MARIHLNLPEHYVFNTIIPVRINDINYGNHLGNDAVVSIMHEARMQYLSSIGCSEMDVFGASLIQADTVVVYKSEGYYGDKIKVDVTPVDFTRAGFDLYYLFTNQNGKIIAQAKTGMVCYDYNAKKIVAVPDAFVNLYK